MIPMPMANAAAASLALTCFMAPHPSISDHRMKCCPISTSGLWNGAAPRPPPIYFCAARAAATAFAKSSVADDSVTIRLPTMKVGVEVMCERASEIEVSDDRVSDLGRVHVLAQALDIEPRIFRHVEIAGSVNCLRKPNSA